MITFDLLYILFALPALLVGLIATILMKVWTGKYMKQQNVNHITGIETVEKIATAYNIPISLEIIDGNLTDHYDPSSHTLRLSREIAQETTIAAVAIAAHELGHAMQHKKGSVLLKLRNTLVPTLSIGTTLGYILLIAGIMLSMTTMSWIGIILFSGTTIFSLLTLPIELDASRKALIMIQKQELLFSDEVIEAQKVLSAAALTYVAATLQSLMTLMYFVYRVKD